MNKIWVLFSIENQYDQPEHNMEGWWKEKPSIENLAKQMGIDITKGDEGILAIVGMWKGDSTRYGNTDYWLEEVKEGMLGNQQG